MKLFNRESGPEKLERRAEQAAARLALAEAMVPAAEPSLEDRIRFHNTYLAVGGKALPKLERQLLLDTEELLSSD